MKPKHIMFPEFKELLDRNQINVLKEILRELLAPDTAELIEGLNDNEKIMVFRLLDKGKALEVFDYLSEKEQMELLEKLEKNRAKELLDEMASDERADLFLELPTDLKKRLIALLEEKEKQDVEKLLKYKENTAGAIMTTEYASVEPEMTVKKAMESLRKSAPNRETIYYIYVIDKESKLVGVLSLKDLILAEPNILVKDIMRKEPIFVSVSEDQEKVAHLVEKYDFLALPVVAEKNRLVGIVTVDDVVDVIQEEDTEDMHKMAAMEALEDEYLETPFFIIARKRIVWLLILILTYTISTQLLKHYSYALETIIALAYFIPMLSGSAGNAGTQSATIITRGLATGEINYSQIFKILRREIAMGVTLGTCLGAFGYIRALYMQLNPLLGLTVGVALTLVVTIATLTGGFLPIFLSKLKIDPAISAGPFLTTILDITSLLIYFQVAKFLLSIH
jgi:magnesium transporter